MRHVAKREIRWIGGIRLYLDDYYKLMEILQRGGKSKLEIAADDFELAEADEIEQLKLKRTTVGKLELRMSGRYSDLGDVEQQVSFQWT